MSFILPKPKSISADEVVLKRADWDEVVATLEDLLEDADDVAAVAAARADDDLLAARVEAKRGTAVETTIPVEVVKAELAGAHPIRAWRNHRNWTVATLSAKSGVSRETIERLETRRTVGSAATLAVLARSLGVPPDVLSEDDDEEKGEAR
ncbi:MAG: helix-turn-helix transcriptional regulator [Alphaproteobacteria bacterium]|nr:helix-turn-helix transcriptional regulator [Alphaproteobacteria bacterium]MBV9553029.1 helix-turn-helix transcriptional regulator [Alphaproteobacteria bacterium]